MTPGKRSLKKLLHVLRTCRYYSTSDKLSNNGRFPRRPYCSSFLFYVDLGNTLLCHFQSQQYAEYDRSFTIGSLSKDVFERRTSTGSEAFLLYICLDANKFVLLSFFSLIKRIYPRVSTKPLPNDAKSPLPVDVRRSKTLLLKLPINITHSPSHWFVQLESGPLCKGLVIDCPSPCGAQLA